MRSRKIISSDEVQRWAWNWLAPVRLLDHGWQCKASVMWSVLIRAAARQQTLHAACSDLMEAPCLQAMLNGLRDGLPAEASILEQQLVEGLQAGIPRSVLRKARQVAIDWHLIPYYGEPYADDNELYHAAARLGTTKFHAYATACILQNGQRYTVALSWVKQKETLVKVIQRLLEQMRQKGLRIKVLLLDRQFFTRSVMKWLIERRQAFLMPVALRGRKPKAGRPLKGLRALKRRPVGRYMWTQGSADKAVTFSVHIVYKTYVDRRRQKRCQKKLMFAAWHVNGTPQMIAKQYRSRFGIETSYRQLNQARIRTCTADPRLRLLFVGVGFILRNVWVWIHGTILCKKHGDQPELQRQSLPFQRLLDQLCRQLQIRNHSPPCVIAQ